MTQELKKELAIFDFDGTLTTKDSFNDFLFFAFGRKRVLWAYLRFSWAVLLYLVRLAPNELPKKLLFSYFFKNIGHAAYKNLCKEYTALRLPVIVNTTGYYRLKWHLERGDSVFIISASPADWIRYYFAHLDIDGVFGAEIEIKDQKITGNFANKISFGRVKADILVQLKNKEKDCLVSVYGDSRGDKEMLGIADNAYLNDYGLSENIIITDGQWRKTLSAVRSLGKSHHNILVVGESPFTMSFFSRFCSYKHKVNDRILQSAEIVNVIKKCCGYFPNSKKPILMPMEEKTVTAVLENRAVLSEYVRFLLPPEKMFNIANDKAQITEFAKKNKITTPRTFAPNSPQQLICFLQKLNYKQKQNYILKPSHGQGSAGIVYRFNRDTDIVKHWEKYGKLILQERISFQGDAVGTSFIFDQNRKLICKFSHKRISEYPNTGGPSTSRISIKIQDLEDKAQRLLEKLNWVGVAMVEWKLDVKTNEYNLLEINPRFWGSLELAVRSGVNFPELYILALQNLNISNDSNYVSGVKCRWMIPGDILRYLSSTSSERESFGDFFVGLPFEAEEWDASDIKGSLATVFCSFLLLISSKRYWRFLSTKR